MQFKSFIRYLVLPALVVVVILQALFLNLPAIVETIIIETRIVKRFIQKHLPQEGVVSDLKFKIEKIGMRHTLVSHINLGSGLSAELVDLQYHLKDLKTFQLEKITISGLRIQARVDADNQLHFNGAAFPRKIKKTPKDSGDSNHSKANPFLGFLPKQVVLKKANLSITTSDHKILIPFEVLASLDTLNNKAVLNASFHPFGQTVKTVISGDFYSGIEFFRLKARSFYPEVLSGVLSGFLPKTGNIRVTGPVDIDILKRVDTDWQLSLSQLKVDLSNLPGGKIKSGAKIKNFTAAVRTKLSKIEIKGGFDLSGSLVPAMGMVFDLKLDHGEDSTPFFDLTMKNKKVNKITLDRGADKMSFNQPHLSLTLKGDLAHQTGQFLFDCKNLSATHGKEKFFIKKILLKSGIKGDFSDKGNGLNFDVQSDLSRIKLVLNKGQASFASSALTGKVTVSKQFHPLVQLEARIKNGKINSPEYKVAATGINARLPLIFPFVLPPKRGSFLIQKIGYDNKFTASARGSITQREPLGVKMGGQVTIADLDGFNLRFEGRAGGGDPSARIDFVTDTFLLMPAHMGKIIPGLSLSDLSLSDDSVLQFSTRGTIVYKHYNLKTQASIMIDRGDLYFPDMNFTLKGIAGKIDFNDLVDVESLPGQVLTIDKITAGQSQFDKTKLRFSIEDGKSINVENLRFNWCNGLVSTESFRLPAKEDHLSLILYCDRLELSRLLKEMGAFHAEGEGTLSGRIPVVYSHGNISFDNGFLFSTPGKGGRVVIENTGNLLAGIPLGTPEFSQLDLASEALKDFDYKSAKLELNTFEDTLYVKMELDGKPAKLLPFEYKKEIGSFIRVDAESPGSLFQGIKMNVNLKLPFNQVLKFGNKIKNVFN